MPVAVLMTIGKTASRKTTAIFDGASMPKTKMNNGASATVGVAYTADTQGSTTSLMASLLAMATPSRMPNTAAMAKPTKNSFRLTRMCRPSSPVAASCRNLTQMSDMGARISGHRPLRPAISQARPTISSDSSPRMVDECVRYQRRRRGSRRWRSSSRPRAMLAIDGSSDVVLQLVQDERHSALTEWRCSGVEYPGDQAIVDILHRIRRQVGGPGSPLIFHELLHVFLVDPHVLGDGLTYHVQVVDRLCTHVAAAHRLLGDGDNLVLVGRIVDPSGNCIPRAQEIGSNIRVVLIPVGPRHQYDRVHAFERGIIVGVVDFWKTRIPQNGRLWLELRQRVDRFGLHARRTIVNCAGLDQGVIARSNAVFQQHDLHRGRVGATDQCRNAKGLALQLRRLVDVRLGQQHVGCSVCDSKELLGVRRLVLGWPGRVRW